MLKIFSAEKVVSSVKESPGEYFIEKSRLVFPCTNGYIYPKIVQAEGKKKMAAEDFVRGLRISE
jgi:methionyl-tRNA formyltransferase